MNLKKILLSLYIVIFSLTIINAQDSVTNPEDFFSFRPGTDRELISYEKLTDYFKLLDSQSEMVKMTEAGKSPMGKPIYIVFISSEKNIASLAELRTINSELALNPGMSDEQREDIIGRGKVFVLGTHSIHSSEVGPAQSLPLTAYRLVTSDDEEIRQIMENVVFMAIPTPNPDGMDMIVDNYYKNRGTKYEGASLPGLYHKYVGHDNNRDFVNLTQEDTRVLSAIFSTEWFPQVYIDKHQMGSTGVRYFVPPLHDPIADIIDAESWSWTGIFGANMLKDMTADGLAGVSTHTIFDLYWPGATLTAIWKNVIGMLTEAASVKTATPVFVESTEIQVGGKGLSEHKKGVNLPMPWEGGWWHLSDIVTYEMSSTLSVLKTASRNKDEILRFRNDMCRKEVLNGKNMPPYYYHFPAEQRDKSEFVNLVNLMIEHGVEVYRVKSTQRNSAGHFMEGDIIIPLSQPYRPFIIEVMEVQQYPVRHYTPGGEVIKPYDITSWSLPLHRQVEIDVVNQQLPELGTNLEKLTGPFSLAGDIPKDAGFAIFPAEQNGSFKAALVAEASGLDVQRINKSIILEGHEISAGSFAIRINSGSKETLNNIDNELGYNPDWIKTGKIENAAAFSIPRIALVETWFSSTDAGWTRYLFDYYHLPYKVLRPADFENTDFVKDYDVVVFPSVSKSLLMSGKYRADGSYLSGTAHPDYIKGMGQKGFEKLMTFLDNGGIIVSWGDSNELFEGTLEIKHGKETDSFILPFSISKDPYKKGLYIPGSLVQAEVLPDHPLTFGMPATTGLYFSNSNLFSTSIPGFDMDRRVIVRYPEKNILLSGYAENEEEMGNMAAMIWMRKGKGQLVLFGFNPQFRASTQSTYKLLFNALLLGK